MENSAWSDEDIEFLAKEMEDESRGEIIDAMKEDQYFAPQYDEADGDEEYLAEIDKEVLEVSDRIFNEVIELGVEWVARRLLDGQETEPTYELELMESEAYLAKKWKEEGWSKKDMDDWCFDDSTRALDEIGFVESSKELSAMNRQLAPALDKLFPKVWSYRDRLDMLDDLERVHRANAENEEGFAYAIDEETGSLVIDLNDGRGRHKLSPDDLPKMIEMNLDVLYDESAFHKRERLDDDSDQWMIDLFERAERNLKSLNEKMERTAKSSAKSLAETASLSGLRPLDIEKDFNSLLPAGMKKLGSEELKYLAEYSSLSQDEFYYDRKTGKTLRLWSSDTYDFDPEKDRGSLHDSGAEDILETAIEEAKGDIKFCLEDGTPEGLKRAEKWKAFFEEKLGALRESSRDFIDVETEKVRAAEKTLEFLAKKAEPETAPASALEDFEKEMEALMAGTVKNPFLAARRILANWKDERKDELNESFRELGLDDGKKFVAYFEDKFGPDKAPRRLEKTEKERKNSDHEMGR